METPKFEPQSSVEISQEVQSCINHIESLAISEKDKDLLKSLLTGKHRGVLEIVLADTTMVSVEINTDSSGPMTNEDIAMDISAHLVDVELSQKKYPDAAAPTFSFSAVTLH